MDARLSLPSQLLGPGIHRQAGRQAGWEDGHEVKEQSKLEPLRQVGTLINLSPPPSLKLR